MKTISLVGCDFVAKVDDADHGWLSQFRWYRLVSGDLVYAMRDKPDRDFMHRIIMRVGRGQMVDHADGDSLNNQRSNLRLCTPSQNNANRRGYSKSGFKGVYRSGRNRWQAMIGRNGRPWNLGSFTSPEGAARAYDAAAIKEFGEFARLNFPSDQAA